MARRKRRGVSIGTYVLTVLCMLTIFVGVILFTRISGDIGEISLNPKILSESFETVTQTITDTQPQSTANVDALSAQANPTVDAPVIIESPVRTLTLSAAGQITVGDDLRRSARVGGAYDFSAIFQPVAHAFANADLSVVTLRTLLTDESSRYSTYYAPSELVPGMKANGIQLFNLATDRIMDDGPRGIEKTRSILQTAQATTAGAYLTSDERNALPVKEINGVKVGVLSYTESISSTGKRSADNETTQNSVRMLDLEAAKADIATLRQKGAEVIIVLAHWGGRSDTKVSRETREAAEALVDAGADIILGTNPTQVLEIERRTVTNSNGSARDAFIAYSLGNFLVDDTRESASITGMILGLSLSYDTQTRALSILDAWYMPTWIMRWKDQTDQNRYRIVPAGVSAPPSDMTGTVFNNMNKSYQSLLTKLDATVARPRPE